ncbi:hypothetical protein AgCh_024153 [Apium graveolens]
MSGDFPKIPTTGSAANGAIHPSDPFVSLQNVNPSANIIMPLTFSHVFPSIPIQGQECVPPLNRPAIEKEMGDGSGGYEQNGEHTMNNQDSVQQTPNMPVTLSHVYPSIPVTENQREIAPLNAKKSELMSGNNELEAAVSMSISDCSQLLRDVAEIRQDNAERIVMYGKLYETMSIIFAGGPQTVEGAASPTLYSETQAIYLNPILQLEGGFRIDDGLSIQARTSLTNLARRLTTAFRFKVSSSNDDQSWTSLSDCPEEIMRLSLWRATEPGYAVGLYLSSVCSIHLPYSHHHVFDFLQDARRRDLIDNPFNNTSFHEVASSGDGSHPGSRISLLRVDGPLLARSLSESLEFMLQESFTNESESVIAYTSLDQVAARQVMSGTDTSIIPIRPLGYVIAPKKQIITNAEQVFGTSRIQKEEYTYPGCLLTVVYQILCSPDPHADHNFSNETIAEQIRSALHHIRATISRAISIM